MKKIQAKEKWEKLNTDLKSGIPENKKMSSSKKQQGHSCQESQNKKQHPRISQVAERKCCKKIQNDPSHHLHDV